MNITKNALVALKQMKHSGHPEAYGFAITLLPGCCAPKIQFTLIDQPKASDKVISVEGIPLYADSQTYELLAGYTIDYINHEFKLDYMPKEGRCCR